MTDVQSSELETYTVRRVEESEADSLEHLMAAYGRELSEKDLGVASDDWLRKLFKQDFVLIYGVFDRAEPVGFAIVFELPEAVFRTTAAQLDDLFISPSHRGLGLGGRLINLIIEDAKRRGWAHLRWMVPETDAPAIRLYEKLASAAPWKNFIVRLNAESSL